MLASEPLDTQARLKRLQDFAQNITCKPSQDGAAKFVDGQESEESKAGPHIYFPKGI